MRMLSLTTILACVGSLFLGLGTFVLFTPEALTCVNPSNGWQQNILGVVEVYNLDYQRSVLKC